ncbi:aldehyde dehydrogenase EutE [Rhodospirillum rubrum]|uniref:aldehyde dehydrogenase family protein n=1 Tax=Rhodospirillum rubrum TaxID=1085 RepID=UPI001902EBD5|nr:aldehyde dehydrogenase family protein [Rhodospirillum rubrum]MBK1664604.1 aldehyde dehydrogenase EutE [Rhodospirillum rubrum]MBK1677245.1 aldehyde dehydrogenase EutE [Rhodospirillum rubrum]
MNDGQIAAAVAKVLEAYGVPADPSAAAPAPAAPTAGSVSELIARGIAKASSDDQIAQIVAKVVGNYGAQAAKPALAVVPGAAASAEAGDGVFDTMDAAVDAAVLAQQQYLMCSMSDRQRFVDGIREVILQKDTLELISRMAAEDTGMGNYEHKLIKNRLAAEKTPGTEDLTTEAFSGDDGLTLVEYSPFGAIGAVTPTTNPTETIICNSIGMLAAGNSVIFSPHPRATKVSLLTVKLINQKLACLGAPANLVVTVSKPSVENTNAMMAHPKIRMLVATGGPGIVKAVMSTGKKAIGAGAGNPPVVVDETADIEKAALDIINGCSFDNNLPCIAEKEIIAVAQIADYLIFSMKKQGAYQITDPAVLRKLQDLVLTAKGGPQTSCVGKSAVWLLNKIGIEVDSSVKVILMEVPKEHPFVQEELMMPILPLVRVSDVDEAIAVAIEVEHGNRHTAIMHSTNVRKLTKMAKLIQTTIFVKNGPSYAGLGVGGEGYTTFTIAGPTGEGLTSAKSFARKRKCVMVEALNIR